ncbi:Tetratricopeptide repeat-containing protein [Amycolatopsis marina]|uniref:Tetratricopeptide repeat-containing protein n=1 Tax=Amycolatopsis marina TaxID=490629 RepID=A0A1I1CQH0_9PSEU|nr:tetratricopeptide repeat protein [Amycolatopsis marina]SFB63128.1 Tetratricopeptide repeat-containing protein [Amycolatopsis marina]
MAGITRFGMEVQRWRRQRGMSLAVLSEKTSFSESYLSKVLHGHRPLPLSLAAEIDAVLGAKGALLRVAEREEGLTRWDAMRPSQLPPALAGFVGRTEYLRTLDASLRVATAPGAATTVIEGASGIGKTALALHWAASLVERFPAGCLYADLQGFDVGQPRQPDAVLDEFLGALGVARAAEDSLSQRTARLRSVLASRPMLVVLDNAASYEQVRPLLPGAGSVVIITSRVHLSGLALHAGATHVRLSPLRLQEGVQLLGELAGRARVAAETASAELIVRHCGGLPLAVRIAGEHLATQPHLTLREMAHQLGPQSSRLDFLASADETTNVRGVIDLSYRALKPAEAAMFRLLGLHAQTPISVGAAAALAGTDIACGTQSLSALANSHLVESSAGQRVKMHHLVQLYATERAQAEETPAQRDGAVDRLLRWYCASAANATNVLAPDWAGRAIAVDTAGISAQQFTFDDHAGAIAWCETELDAITSVTHLAATRGISSAWILPSTLQPFFYLTKKWSAWIDSASQALHCAKAAADDLGIARCQQNLAAVLSELGKTDDALTLLQDATRRHHNRGDDEGQGWTAVTLGLTYTRIDRPDDAIATFTEAAKLFERGGLELSVAVVHAMLGTVYGRVDRLDDGIDCLHEAIRIAQRHDSPLAESLTRHHLGALYLHSEQPQRALPQLDRALAIRRIQGERWGYADTLVVRAETLKAMGEHELSVECLREAIAVFDDLKDPRGLELHATLATTTPSFLDTEP